MSALTDRLDHLRTRVAAAAERSGRTAADVRILLATKTQTPETIAEAVAAGFRLIGENRVQELTEKYDALNDLVRPHIATLPEAGSAPAAAEPGGSTVDENDERRLPALERHFIGRLQSNKVNAVVPLVSCVESVHDLALARKLSTTAERAGRDLDVMLQVNVSGETTKSGVTPETTVETAVAIVALPHLRLTGLMTIGLNDPDPGAVAIGYRRLRELSEQVRALPGAAGAVDLSMGMSGDYELAIAEGATIIRIGAAVFGARPTY